MSNVSQVAEGLSLLTLRFDVLDDRPDWPVVTILVDSEEPFRSVAAGWRGFDPAQILGEDSPLKPADAGRRVAVSMCSCGIAGCGVIAPMIVASPDGRRVSWVDFRNYTGVFDRPIADEPGTQGRLWNLPDIHFDRRQYLEEVDRATADLSWETRRRATARLLERRLREVAPTLPPGLRLTWVAPHWGTNGVLLSYFEPFDYRFRTRLVQVLLRLTSDETDPADAAADMLTRFLAVAPEDRARVFRDQVEPFGAATTTR
jgi:hypothetical protein